MICIVQAKAWAAASDSGCSPLAIVRTLEGWQRRESLELLPLKHLLMYIATTATHFFRTGLASAPTSHVAAVQEHYDVFQYRCLLYALE